MIFLLYLATLVSLSLARQNVLLLVADDFRPNLGLYDEANAPLFNSPHMITPHLDRLAERSLVFDKAFCQTSLCGPSRASFLTGRRPDTTRVHGNSDMFREVGGNFTTLPQFFKENGYTTLSSGKIFHGYHNNSKHNDFPWSWDEKPFQAADIDVKNMSYHLWPEDSPLKDIVNTGYALEQLRQVAPEALLDEKNFFLALGIHKPHQPWDFPASFYDLYSKESIELPYNKYAPSDMPDLAWTDFANPRRAYWDWNNTNLGIPDLGQINVTFPDWKIKQIRRAYYASVSYMDSQMGRILTELEDLELASNTVVAFLGDHGFQLGEHGEYAKWNNFEISNRVPLLVAVPGASGKHTDGLVELVDVFPTIVEAAGFPALPTCSESSRDEALCSEGKSLLPLALDEPDTNYQGKGAVFYQRAYGMWSWDVTKRMMAYSIRTDDGWRYTEYIYMKNNLKEGAKMGEEDNSAPVDQEPDWERPADHPELYNLNNDPWETENLYKHEELSQVMEELSARLRLGWRGEMVDC